MTVLYNPIAGQRCATVTQVNNSLHLRVLSADSTHRKRSPPSLLATLHLPRRGDSSSSLLHSLHTATSLFAIAMKCYEPHSRFAWSHENSAEIAAPPVSSRPASLPADRRVRSDTNPAPRYRGVPNQPIRHCFESNHL